jgi:acetyl-CoA carboxylase biotin carboxyl carrier protein
MTIKNGHLSQAIGVSLDQAQKAEEFITVEQLQYLVRMLDKTDVSELEVKDAQKKACLVLRKAKPVKSNEIPLVTSQLPEEDTSSTEQTPYTLTAPLVGIFHLWSLSKERLLVKVGDRIKERQHVGVIQSLNVANEVESPVAGSVIEILAHDGQLVEYGQPLMIIDHQ